MEKVIIYRNAMDHEIHEKKLFNTFIKQREQKEEMNYSNTNEDNKEKYEKYV